MISKNTKEYIKNKKKQGLYGLELINTVHPGATLQDELDFFGLTQKELAKKIGYSIQTVNRIVKGREPITIDIALALERVFDGRPVAQFWLNMQADYDKQISKVSEFMETKEELSFFKSQVKATFKELQQGGVFENYILNTEDSYKRSIIKIKDFFGSHSLKTIPDEFLLGVAFRKGSKKNINQYNLAAILKIGEKKAKKILKENSVSEYDKESFVCKLKVLKKLSNKKPKDFLEILQKESLGLGVIVVYVPNMNNTVFGGATLWLANRPVILLKVEKQREDIFWFNFYHEAGHVVKHSKREVFVDFDEDGKKEKIEIEADDFASSMLIPNFDEISKEAGSVITDSWFEFVSKKTGVSKSIVTGRVCHIANFEGAWKTLNKYRPTIKEKVTFI